MVRLAERRAMVLVNGSDLEVCRNNDPTILVTTPLEKLYIKREIYLNFDTKNFPPHVKYS